MSSSSVVLYRVAGPESLYWWMTDVSIQNGEVLICSGDNHGEWYIRINATLKDSLLEALLKQSRKEQDNEGDTDQLLLNLMMEQFGDQKANPFNAIKLFLDKSGIEWKPDFWGSI